MQAEEAILETELLLSGAKPDREQAGASPGEKMQRLTMNNTDQKLSGQIGEGIFPLLADSKFDENVKSKATANFMEQLNSFSPEVQSPLPRLHDDKGVQADLNKVEA